MKGRTSCQKLNYLFIGAASIAIILGLFFLGCFSERETLKKRNDYRTMKRVYKITELEVGAIQDIVKETYIAGNPVTTTIKPVDKQGNFFYNEVMGMQKVVELKYKAIS